MHQAKNSRNIVSREPAWQPYKNNVAVIRCTMTDKIENQDVIVIGGGLAGLTVTTLLTRAGKSVTLFEQSSSEIIKKRSKNRPTAY
jgi:pyruvate/2-oxoglutarate dehydrogenase complex dihydrolipoamide dehydrogenase (E3) component